MPRRSTTIKYSSQRNPQRSRVDFRAQSQIEERTQAQVELHAYRYLRVVDWAQHVEAEGGLHTGDTTEEEEIEESDGPTNAQNRFDTETLATTQAQDAARRAACRRALAHVRSEEGLQKGNSTESHSPRRGRRQQRSLAESRRRGRSDSPSSRSLGLRYGRSRLRSVPRSDGRSDNAIHLSRTNTLPDPRAVVGQN